MALFITFETRCIRSSLIRRNASPKTPRSFTQSITPSLIRTILFPLSAFSISTLKTKIAYCLTNVLLDHTTAILSTQRPKYHEYTHFETFPWSSSPVASSAGFPSRTRWPRWLVIPFEKLAVANALGILTLPELSPLIHSFLLCS